MTAISDNMFRAVLVGVVFLVTMGAFNALFIGDQLTQQGKQVNFGNMLTGFGDMFSKYPELAIIDLVLGATFIVVILFVARELLPA